MAQQQESFLPLSSRQSLSCCLSRVAKRSTPKPRGPLPFPQNRVVLFPTSEPRGSPLLLQNHMDLYLSTCFRTSWVYSFLQSHMVSSFLPQNLVVLPPPMAAVPRFKSQRPSSFAAPFPTPPTISYTCQHSRILPALLGCHSKSGQVWPHHVEPIISKLLCRCYNQGELLPSYILGGSHSHPPGSKHAHSYLTYL